MKYRFKCLMDASWLVINWLMGLIMDYDSLYQDCPKLCLWAKDSLQQCFNWPTRCFQRKKELFQSFFSKHVKYLMPFFVIYDRKWRVFGFWTVGWTKEAMWRCYFGLWEIVMSISHNYFWHFVDFTVNRLKLQ